jgi:GNAT superfamily N-acetyltransferase
MANQKPQLREADLSDSDLCFEIKRKAFGDYIEEIWGWNEQLQRQLHDKDFEPGKFKIVHLDGQDIGVLGVRPEGNSLWISKIYILPLHQNRGYGTRLIREVVAEADRQGKSVKLQVLKINLAKKLYDRLGFVITGTNGPHHVMERPVSASARDRSA